MRVYASWSYDRGGVAGSTLPSFDAALVAFHTSVRRILQLQRDDPFETNRLRQAERFIFTCMLREAFPMLMDGHTYSCEEDGLMIWLRPYP